jgi:U3 small nucleolar RNA-associated protein 6
MRNNSLINKIAPAKKKLWFWKKKKKIDKKKKKKKKRKERKRTMADRIQRALEGMVDELEEQRKVRLFNEAEIRGMVRKRTDFEYSLCTGTTCALDYVRYADYEQNVYRLLSARIRRLKIKQGAQWFLISQRRRVVTVYERAVHRYPGTLALWQRYLDYCSSCEESRRLNALFGRALQLHPTHVPFWLRAARHQFDENANMDVARKLMLRALRINRSSELLWIQYFRFEYCYIDRIRKRMSVLGVDEAAREAREQRANGGDNDDDNDGGDHIALASDDDDDSDKEDKDEAPLTADGDPLSSHASFGLNTPFFAGAIPEAVYRNAVAALPDSVAFRLRFVDEARRHKNAQVVRDRIYEDIARTFGDESIDATDAYCRRYVRECPRRAFLDDARRASLASYWQALERCASAALFERLVDFVGEQRPVDVDELLRALDAAHSRHMCSPRLYALWANALLNLSRVEQAERVLDAAIEAHPSSADLWVLRIEHTVRRSCAIDEKSSDGDDSDDDDDGKRRRQRLHALAKRVPAEKSGDRRLWLWKARLACTRPWRLRRLLRIGAAAMNELAGDDTLKARLMALAEAHGSVGDVRRFYTLALSFGAVGAAFFAHCIRFEQALPSAARSTAQQRALLEQSARVHGAHSADAWLDYMQFEYEHGTVQRATALYWRAKRSLESPASFIEQHNRLYSAIQ